VGARDVGGATPLHLAARAGDGACCAALLAAGAAVDATSACGATPLHCAWGCAVAALLAARADVAIADVCGWTALHAAAHAGDAAVVAALLAAGADGAARTRDAETPAQLAPPGAARDMLLGRTRRRRPPWWAVTVAAAVAAGAAAHVALKALRRRHLAGSRLRGDAFTASERAPNPVKT
jgi:hypothetical protein